MEGFKKDFYITSSKKERKPEANLGQSSYTQPQPFSQQSQQLGIQQNYEERKQTQKSSHVLTPMSEEKLRKQTKSALHQEISEFNPSGQMSIEQLIKVVLNLQEDVEKLRKDNEKLMQKLILAEGIESRLMCMERELKASFETYHKKQTELKNRLGKIEEKLQTFKKEQSETGAIEMEIEAQKEQIQQGKQLKIKKKCFYCGSVDIFSELLEILIEIKKLLDKRTTNEEKRRRLNEKNILQPGWFNIQEQDGTISSKRKENLEKPELLISLELDDSNIYIQQQGA